LIFKLNPNFNNWGFFVLTVQYLNDINKIVPMNNNAKNSKLIKDKEFNSSKNENDLKKSNSNSDYIEVLRKINSKPDSS
jgi:hypothetical protein